MTNQDSKQIIYFGAPGTGKSHTIETNLKYVPKKNKFRTTFHPDSDYSTFAGTYKPTMEEEKIIYKFVPQAFLNAYMQAYRNLQASRKNETEPENVYLIIEEINRGNCAQVFGDLFQLLDRKEDGYSEYPIKADEDVKKFLDEEMGWDSDAIKDGELSLPPNLYIYATMNTSDQSLFPMDSAFKRRWDWKYIPIMYNNDCKIVVDGTEYSWVSFQRIVNDKIFEATGLEDKMLGDWFVKPEKDENGNEVIDKEVFRDKILFYLWNDVCRDGDADIFKIKTDNQKIQKISFSDLYGDDGPKNLKAMMEYLMEEYLKVKNSDESTRTNDEQDGFYEDKHLQVIFPDGDVIKEDKAYNTLVEVINKIGPERVYNLHLERPRSKYKLITKEELKGQQSKPLNDGFYVTTKTATDIKRDQLQKISDLLGLGLIVSIIVK